MWYTFKVKFNTSIEAKDKEEAKEIIKQMLEHTSGAYDDVNIFTGPNSLEIEDSDFLGERDGI